MHRDTLQWVAALDIMLELKAEKLVPQHTRPLEGAETIKEVVTAYRDAIQFVHDQTVRFSDYKIKLRQELGRLQKYFMIMKKIFNPRLTTVTLVLSRGS